MLFCLLKCVLFISVCCAELYEDLFIYEFYVNKINIKCFVVVVYYA